MSQRSIGEKWNHRRFALVWLAAGLLLTACPSTTKAPMPETTSTLAPVTHGEGSGHETPTTLPSSSNDSDVKRLSEEVDRLEAHFKQVSDGASLSLAQQEKLNEDFDEKFERDFKLGEVDEAYTRMAKAKLDKLESLGEATTPLECRKIPRSAPEQPLYCRVSMMFNSELTLAKLIKTAVGSSKAIWKGSLNVVGAKAKSDGKVDAILFFGREPENSR
jgi:hypothetical protein